MLGHLTFKIQVESWQQSQLSPNDSQSVVKLMTASWINSCKFLENNSVNLSDSSSLMVKIIEQLFFHRCFFKRVNNYN